MRCRSPRWKAGFKPKAAEFDNQIYQMELQRYELQKSY